MVVISYGVPERMRQGTRGGNAARERWHWSIRRPCSATPSAWALDRRRNNSDTRGPDKREPLIAPVSAARRTRGAPRRRDPCTDIQRVPAFRASHAEDPAGVVPAAPACPGITAKPDPLPTMCHKPSNGGDQARSGEHQQEKDVPDQAHGHSSVRARSALDELERPGSGGRPGATGGSPASSIWIPRSARYRTGSARAR